MGEHLNLHTFKAVLARANLLLFPSVCRGCQRLMNPLGRKNGGFPYLCESCADDLPWKEQAKSCQRCGNLTAEKDRLRCPACSARKYHFHQVWCAFYYADPLRQWILDLKFHRQESTIHLLGRLLSQAPFGTKPLENVDWVAPVPLHPKRLRERGFNQSLLLAHALLTRAKTNHSAQESQQPTLLPDLLVRNRHTKPQFELLSDEREANVADAFAVNPSHLDALQGSRVLLVDDLLTSGATLNACAKALRSSGARQVTALVLARA